MFLSASRWSVDVARSRCESRGAVVAMFAACAERLPSGAEPGREECVSRCGANLLNVCGSVSSESPPTAGAPGLPPAADTEPSERERPLGPRAFGV